MSKEEEVMMEVEAVRSVYGDDDCTVLSPYPPHIRVHVVPRTAYVTSQQFVEADIEIQATSQYPDVPPTINVMDSKGLDEDRLEHLRSSLHRKAADLASCLMLVALCEEAVEKVSAMNHPDGNCPLCLYPLVPHDEGESLPFMKLMSCFHCFHSACIIGWWEWLQMQNDHQNPSSRTSSSAGKNIKDNMRSCPICRKVFHVEDIEHVINLAGSQMSELNLEKGIDDGLKLIASDSETSRRHQFEAMPRQKVLVKRSFGLEEGEIEQAPRAAKLPRTGDPPHPNVASASRTPAELAGHAARNQPGEREVFARRSSPTPQDQPRTMKRAGGHYSGSKVARLCLGPMHHSSGAVPKIVNLPDPRMGIMLSEDNALAGIQALATSQQADLDHYMSSSGSHMKDWIFRDLKVNLSRAAIAAEAVQRMFLDKDRESFDRSRHIHDLEEKVKELQAENKALQGCVDQEKERSREDRGKLKEVQGELAAERFRNEGLESKLRDMEERLAAAEKQKETVDLEKIRSTYFDEWITEWADTKEGEDWLYDVSKSARAMAFWEALQIAKAHYPEVDAAFLQTKLRGCDGIGVNEKGEAFLLSEVVDPTRASTSAADVIPSAPDEGVSIAAANDSASLAETNARLHSAGFDNVATVAVSDLLSEEGRVDIPEEAEGDDSDDEIDVET